MASHGERKRLRLNAVAMDGETLRHADDDAPDLQPEGDNLCDYNYELKYKGLNLQRIWLKQARLVACEFVTEAACSVQPLSL